MTQILQNHTNKVFLHDISQGYSIKVPRGTASIFSSKQRSGQKKKKKKLIFTYVVFIHLDACESM